MSRTDVPLSLPGVERISPAVGGATLALAVWLGFSAFVRADDWPQWRGPLRDGVWREAGITDRIPAGGLPILWRVRVGQGYSGPAVARGRVYLTDRRAKPEAERVLCFDAASGAPLWSHEWPCDYANMEYGNGPRACPTVHNGKVYALGTKGRLVCLDAATGELVWEKVPTEETVKLVPRYGASAAPLAEGDVLITCSGGLSGATVVAYDQTTGAERWKALEDRPAYSAPIVVTAGGRRQVVVWTGDNVTGLDPATGEQFWQVPYKATFDPAQAVASPVVHGDLLLCLAAWNRGSLMLKLDAEKPGASVVWKTRSRPTTTISTPFFGDDRHVYAVDGDGGLCCLDAGTGDEIWKTREATSERFGNAHLTPNGDRVFLFNQKGHLILARLTPEGYEERGRCLLVEPTAGFRAADPIAWAHPAYAGRHVFARNDREVVCASLEAEAVSAGAAPAASPAVESRVLAGTTGPDGTLALGLAVAPDGTSVALGSGWGNVKRLSLPAGEPLPAPPRHNDWVCAVAYSPDGRRLVSAGGSEFTPERNGNRTTAEVKVWDVEAGAELGALAGHTNKVFSAAFSPDGQTVATGSADATVRLWDIGGLKERAVLKGHTDTVTGVAFSRDGAVLASSSRDRTVRLWDPVGGAERGTLQGPEEDLLCVAVSPDGRTVAAGCADWTVRLWDVATREPAGRLEGHRGGVYCLAFSPDGKTLVSGSGDETLKLWDAGTWREQATLRGHRSGVTAAAFAPGGRVLVTAGLDDPVRLWDLPPER